MEIMKKRKWKDGDEREHFQSGICAGVGAFNLVKIHFLFSRY